MSQEFFGGRSVLLVGDIMQLGPVRAAPIYKEPKAFESKTLFKSKELNLWNNMESVLLETNFRQGEGEWTQMLNRIRVGKQTDKDMKKLNDRPYTLLTKEEFDDAIHFFCTNLEVNEHNNYRLNALEDLLEEMKASMMHSKGYKPKINESGLIDSTQFAQTLKLKKISKGNDYYKC